MSRKMKQDRLPSTECLVALDRITRLAHRLAATLSGEPLSQEGLAEGPRNAALVMAMMCFLARIDPQDLHALFFSENSLKEARFQPMANVAAIDPPLAGLLQ